MNRNLRHLARSLRRESLRSPSRLSHSSRGSVSAVALKMPICRENLEPRLAFVEAKEGFVVERTRRHIIQLDAGRVEIEEHPEGGVTIKTERLNAKYISAFLNTVWADTDLAICVNGQWLDGAYEAGQHRRRENRETSHA